MVIGFRSIFLVGGHTFLAFILAAVVMLFLLCALTVLYIRTGIPAAGFDI